MLTRNRKKYGFADTKKYPHASHPSYYKKKGKNNIDYLTFTHHPIVEINGKLYETIPLSSNINPDERGKSKSFVYPKKYRGMRSALGKEIDKYSLIDKDKKIVDRLFNELPTEHVKYSKPKKRK